MNNTKIKMATQIDAFGNKYIIAPGWVDYIIKCHTSEICKGYLLNLELNPEIIRLSSCVHNLMKQETLNVLNKYFDGNISIKDFKKMYPYALPNPFLVEVILEPRL